MTGQMRNGCAGLGLRRGAGLVRAGLVTLALTAPMAQAQDATPLPERRVILTEGRDRPGGDLDRILDITREACVATCLARPDCAALTYNAKASACFPKSDAAGEAIPFDGAFAGPVLTTDPAAQDRARTRIAALGDLAGPEAVEAARAQVARLSDTWLVNDVDAAVLRSDASAFEVSGDLSNARGAMAAAVNLTDAPEDWMAYARLWLAGEPDAPAARLAALNGYLRAPEDATAAQALAVMAQADRALGEGRRALATLRLALTLAPGDTGLAAQLAEAADQFGFRITDQVVEADGTQPRICAIFSDLLAEGTDYAPFVSLPSPGLTVEPSGDRLCVGGLVHGERYALTFRQGLPSATGETLPRDMEVAQYVRDRAPQVRFEGRAYVLPRAADAGLPVVTVNTDALDLRLIRVSDRNLVRTLRDGLVARPMDIWNERYVTDEMGQVVWTGTATVGRETNRDVTTRLPVQEVTGPLGPGIYALQAAIPDTDPETVAPATQWFVVSDLGLTALSGTDGLHVVVRGLSDAGAREGAEVRLLSRGNEVLATVATDAQGLATFAADMTRGRDNAAPAALTVTMGDDLAFLPLNDAEFDLSDRGVEGRPPAPPIDVFATTDRGAYRAGETVHATILARNGADQRALPGLPLTAVLVRPDGVEFARQLAPEAGAGGHVVDFALPPTAPRGTWRLDVLADPKAPPLATQRLLVEDFLPERMDLIATLPDGALPATAAPVIALEARHLFGAPATGAEIEGEVRLTAAAAVPGHEGFRFGRADQRFDPQIEVMPLARTDAEGRAQLTATLPKPTGAARPMEATFVLTLREGSGRPVERRLTRTVLPPVPVIGLKPLFEGDAVPQGAAPRMSVLMLSPDGAVTDGPADWVLSRVDTDFQWYQMDGRWDYEPVTRRTEVSRGTLMLAGETELALPALDWGRYELAVTPQGASNGDGAASLAFDAGWYAGGTAEGAPSPDRLSVALDKPEYRAGEMAVVRVDASRAGIGILSVLTNRVVDLRVVDLAQGTNTLDLPVTDAWGTGAYVTVAAIRPLDGAEGHAPVRALGLAHAAIAPGDRALTARIEAPEAADPGGTLPVTLHVEGADPGDQVFATLAAVDLGILNLTGFTAPDPQAHYFGQRRLGVGLRDVYGRLIDGKAGTPGAIRSGGDANALAPAGPPPQGELMTWFSGPLTVGPDGTVQAQVPVVPFDGTVRLMAVVWSGKAVGQAQADVLVRDPVVLTASAPRFLAPGDTSQMLLELTHTTGPAGEMALEASAEGLTLTAPASTIALADKGTARLTIPLTAPDQAGDAAVTLALTTPEGKRIERRMSIPVRANGPEVRRDTRLMLAAGDDLTLPPDLLAGMRPGTGHATLAIGPAARFDSAALLQGLRDYPYGCTEQIASQTLPLIALGNTLPEEDRATANLRVDQAIAKILARQDSNGQFGLWTPEGGDPWLDAYVTDVLSRARAAGHAVPDRAFDMAIDALRNAVNTAAGFDAETNGGGEALAYALMVLAREGQAAVGDLRYYADARAEDFGTPLAVAQLGAALAMVGDQPRADALFARAAQMLAPPEAPEQGLRADFGTHLRDRAGVITLAANAGSTAANVAGLADGLASGLNGQPLSPQEAVWTLMAAGALSPDLGAGGFTLNGAPVEGAVMRDVTAGGGAVLTNGSGRDVPVTLSLTGVPIAPEKAGGRNYDLKRDYFTEDGAPADPTQVAQGTRLVVVLTVTPLDPNFGGRLMVDDPLPAGFEIDNPNLLAAGDVAALAWLDATTEGAASEFREDRFLSAIDWANPQPLRLAYRVRAVSPGQFDHPAASVIDMYRPENRAWTDSGRVTVTAAR